MTQTTPVVLPLKIFREYEDRGLLTCRQHPTEDLLIWNYTPRCVYEQAWDSFTLQARGLITRTDGTIVAFPFPKFFNLGEVPETCLENLPKESYEVTKKLDGSLGILYWTKEGPAIATRGSFTSRQAQWATTYLREHHPFLPANVTLLFEIIYPENRIVVDYLGEEGLHLLGAYFLDTGEEVSREELERVSKVCEFPCPPSSSEQASLQDILRLAEVVTEEEGWVIRYQSGLRVKIKTTEYILLHRIITQTTMRTIWDSLRMSKSQQELLERVPPEFASWVKSVSRDLTRHYEEIYHRSQKVYKEITEKREVLYLADADTYLILTVKEVKKIAAVMRKALSDEFEKYPDIKHILYALYTFQGKSRKTRISGLIWNMIEPPPTKMPWGVREEEEDAS